MNHLHRLERLHVLLDRLERLPASPNRDWMMVEVRARAADVETGVQPVPVRPRNRDEALAQREATAAERKAPRPDGTPAGTPATRADRPSDVGRPRERSELRRHEPDRHAPRRHEPPSGPRSADSDVGQGASPGVVAGRDGRVDLLEYDGVLCLGDPPADTPVDTGHVVSPPWARGLRG
jgi:hypothetical protein